MRKLKWRAAVAAAVTLVAALAAAPFVMADPTSRAADDPGFIQVYNDNVENLPTPGLKCHGDWQDLLYYMKIQKHKPDVYLVHQISGKKQLNKLVSKMEKMFGEKYAARIADPTPKKMKSPCGAPKAYQTNAVIFSTERFSVANDKNNTWQAQAVNAKGKCVDNHQSRTQAVKVKLTDKLSGKQVTAASVHWATGNSGGPPCAKGNAREVAEELAASGYGGDLRIVGGDFNYSDVSSGSKYRGWYKAMNGDLKGKLGYRDVVFDKCAATAEPRACLKANWTSGSGKRIDFLFAATPGGLPKVTGTHTVTYNEGDAADREVTGTDRADRDYSGHRAVRALIHY